MQNILIHQGWHETKTFGNQWIKIMTLDKISVTCFNYMNICQRQKPWSLKSSTECNYMYKYKRPETFIEVTSSVLSEVMKTSIRKMWDKDKNHVQRQKEVWVVHDSLNILGYHVWRARQLHVQCWGTCKYTLSVLSGDFLPRYCRLLPVIKGVRERLAEFVWHFTISTEVSSEIWDSKEFWLWTSLHSWQIIIFFILKSFALFWVIISSCIIRMG